MEVEIKFEPSGKYGVIPAGVYLIDAAKRLGIYINDECGRQGLCDSCAVTIINGADLLSQPTKAELEHLSAERRKKGERLSCQAKIEKTGEITVMVTEKAKPEETTFEKYQNEFSKLPLDEKIKNLMDLESITLGETFNYILNLPYRSALRSETKLQNSVFKKKKPKKRQNDLPNIKPKLNRLKRKHRKPRLSPKHQRKKQRLQKRRQLQKNRLLHVNHRLEKKQRKRRITAKIKTSV